jgi:hypothetical protein
LEGGFWRGLGVGLRVGKGEGGDMIEERIER